MAAALELIALPALITLAVIASLILADWSPGAGIIGVLVTGLVVGTVVGLLRFVRRMEGKEP